MTPGRAIRRAKRMLKKRCERHAWFSGVGIAPTEQGLGLRVTASQKPEANQVPTEYYGFPVEIVVTKGYRARSLDN